MLLRKPERAMMVSDQHRGKAMKWWVLLGCLLTGCASRVDVTPASPSPDVPRLSCSRFEDPLSRDPYPVNGKLIRNRVIPLKAELRDTAGTIVIPSTIQNP